MANKKSKRKEEKKPMAIVVRKETGYGAGSLMQRAIDKNVSVETIEKLMDLQDRHEKKMAKREFDEAMAQFQFECPVIKKTKAVPTKDGRIAYRYAPIDAIVDQTKNLMKEHGFSYAIKTETSKEGVKATCVVRHAGGHSEESSMEVPLGTKTQVMSDSQVTAAALTFAKRYAFCNAFGIMTGDEDTDGAQPQVRQAGRKEKITPEDALLQANDLIDGAETIDALVGLAKRIKASSLFGKEDKDKLSAKINGKIDKIQK